MSLPTTICTTHIFMDIGAIHWSVEDLPVTSFSKKMPLPPQQLSTVNSSSVRGGGMSPSNLLIRMLTGLVLGRFHVSKQLHLLWAPEGNVLFCPGDTVLLCYILTSGSYNLSATSSTKVRGYRGVPWKSPLWLSTQQPLSVLVSK